MSDLKFSKEQTNEMLERVSFDGVVVFYRVWTTTGWLIFDSDRGNPVYVPDENHEWLKY